MEVIKLTEKDIDVLLSALDVFRDSKDWLRLKTQRHGIATEDCIEDLYDKLNERPHPANVTKLFKKPSKIANLSEYLLNNAKPVMK